MREQIFGDMANAGFNLSLFDFRDAASNEKALALGARFGIGIVLADANIDHRAAKGPREPEPKVTVERFGMHSALAAYYLQDEPHTEDFSALRNISKSLKILDPERWSYVDLLPIYATPAQLGSDSYVEYVDRFITSVRPQVVSFNHYPIRWNGAVRTNFYENLEVISAAANKAGLPFWAFTLSTPHLNYPPPVEGHLRFQLFTNLAYGAKGLQYFTYRRELGHDGLIDGAGRPTALYEVARRINSEIQNMGRLLLTLRPVAVYHTGIPPEGTQKFEGYGGVTKTTNIPVILSFMQDTKMRTFLMVVNRNPSKPVVVSLSLASTVSTVGEIDRSSNKLQIIPIRLQQNGMKVQLQAGDGRLFLLTNAN